MRESGDQYPDPHILDLREELEELVPFFQWYALRQLDFSKPCGCNVTNPDKIIRNDPCTRCFRFGYLFTDYIVKGYMWKNSMGFEFKTEIGTISTQRNNFVVKHNRPINKFDNVIVMDTHPDTGVIRQPIRMMRLFQVQDSMPLFGKDGRVEHYKCFVEERNLDDYRSGAIGTTFSYQGNRSGPAF
jgi:hypothetical protein